MDWKSTLTTDSVLLYYITDRAQFPGTEAERRKMLLDRIAEAARCEVDFVQLREKDLCARDLESLARSTLNNIRASRSRTRLLINSRIDVAVAVGAEGVHLRANDVTAEDVRTVWRTASAGTDPLIALSCHSENEVVVARSANAHFVVFGPVFEKIGAPQMPAHDIGSLRAVSRQGVPVLALGGVTVENAAACLDAGASGVAGIRLFQKGDLAQTVKKLRALGWN